MSSNHLSENVKYEYEFKNIEPGVDLQVHSAEVEEFRKLKVSLVSGVRADLQTNHPTPQTLKLLSYSD